MKILSAKQIREWDEFTIHNEPVSSLDLMERAADACVNWIIDNNFHHIPITIFCGKGNNGGDGLAIARKLLEKKCIVVVYILDVGKKAAEDFETNLKRLKLIPNANVTQIKDESHFPNLESEHIIIDAIFGSGLNRPLEGIPALLVNYINQANSNIISIDIPSGMFVDHSSKKNEIIRSKYCLSFQSPKLAFLMPENAEFIGEVHILDIGLLPNYINDLKTEFELTDIKNIKSIHKSRKQFSHKGNFGHALILAGSYGKMGAATLSARACLRSGVGLLTIHIPKSGYEIIQKTVPEAMTSVDQHESIITNIETELINYDTLGIGPGIGTDPATRKLLRSLLIGYSKPMVLDADALNGLAIDNGLLSLLPPGSVLTPHPKEFERLFGESENDFDRIEKTLSNSKKLNVVIVLKGHHTFIATPEGNGFFNNTGNAGMATAGSGDVLTGVLTALLAQGYSSKDAAILGVFIHGKAGDIAAQKFSQESMIASDIVENLGAAFQLIN